jgi:hypothetical protein
VTYDDAISWVGTGELPTVRAVRDELGENLCLTPLTKWTNIPAEVRAEIERVNQRSAG